MAVARAIAPEMQPALELRSREEIERETEEASDAAGEQLTALINACKRVARELSYGHCADELEKLWGRHGRHVTAPTLRACCEGIERNYFRVEWAHWFAQQSDDVAAILREWGGARAPKKTPAEELEDLKRALLEEFPKQAAKLIRKAETR
jgi:hypothetical protein